MGGTALEQITSRILFHDTVIDLCIDNKSIKPRPSSFSELVEFLPMSSICVISNRDGDLVYKLSRKHVPEVVLNGEFINFTLPIDNGSNIGDALKISMAGARKSISRVYKIINGVSLECISVIGNLSNNPEQLDEILFPIKEIKSTQDLVIPVEKPKEIIKSDKPIYSIDPITSYNEKRRRILKTRFDKKRKRLVPRGFRSKKYIKKLNRLLLGKQ